MKLVTAEQHYVDFCNAFHLNKSRNVGVWLRPSVKFTTTLIFARLVPAGQVFLVKIRQKVKRLVLDHGIGLDTHYVKKNRSNRENYIRLESSVIQKER